MFAVVVFVVVVVVVPYEYKVATLDSPPYVVDSTGCNSVCCCCCCTL